MIYFGLADVKTLLELNSDECRYPVTDAAPHRFCGHPQTLGSHYCAEHHATCYLPGTAMPKIRNTAPPARPDPSLQFPGGVIPVDVMIQQFLDKEPSK